MRLPDWEHRFAQIMREMRATPFDAGHHNCVLMAVKVAEAITGRDFIPEYPRGHYRAQAALLRSEGGLRAALDKRLPQIAVAACRQGDVALTNARRPALAVMAPPYAWVPGEHGAHRLDWSELAVAYSVN